MTYCVFINFRRFQELKAIEQLVSLLNEQPEEVSLSHLMSFSSNRLNFFSVDICSGDGKKESRSLGGKGVGKGQITTVKRFRS